MKPIVIVLTIVMFFAIITSAPPRLLLALQYISLLPSTVVLLLLALLFFLRHLGQLAKRIGMNIVRLVFLTILAIGMSIPTPTFAQGTFQARNFNPIDNVNAPIFDANGNRLFGSDYVAMLYGGQATNSLMPALVFRSVQTMAPAPFTYTPGGQFGYFDGGSVAIPNVPGRAFAWLRVVAWDRRMGNTYEDVVALGVGGYGASDLFQGNAGCPDCVSPSPPTALIGLQSFSLLPVVPEPGVGWLLLLGLPFLAARWLKSRRARQ